MRAGDTKCRNHGILYSFDAKETKNYQMLDTSALTQVVFVPFARK